MEKYGKFWKNGRFFRADMAGLEKYHAGRYGRIGVYRVKLHFIIELAICNCFLCFRICIGQNLAMQEQKTVLVHLMRRYGTIIEFSFIIIREIGFSNL